MAINTSTERTARRALVRVSINGHDATAYIAPSLLDFAYTDNISGKADEVQLSLQDREARWNGPWKPQKGMQVEASLTVKDWFAQGEDAILPCGSFKIDEVCLDGPPDIFKIKALSAALTSNLREEQKTRAWENQSLKGIATQISAEHGLELYYAGAIEDEETYMIRQDQREEADLPFMHRLANERAMHCKVHDGKLILSDSIKAEQQSPVLTLSRVGTDTPVTRYSFKQSSSGTDYTKAEAAYTDPSTGQVHTATAQVANGSANDDPKTMQINARMESSAEAMRLSGAALHNANKSTDTASVDCMGHPGLVAGLTVSLTNFGDFSGSYLIEKATHKLGSGGYTTALELRKCRLAPDIRMSSGSVPVAKNMLGNGNSDIPSGSNGNGIENSFTDDQKREQIFDTLTSPHDKLILCMPDIAEHESSITKEPHDAEGWQLLHDLMEKWISNPHYVVKPDDKKKRVYDTCVLPPTKVSWQWLWEYLRVHIVWNELANPSELFSDDAKKTLTKILRMEEAFTHEYYEFNHHTLDWKEWRSKAFQAASFSEGSYVPSPSSLKPDGLSASIGSFTIFALSSGHTRKQADGSFRITVKKVFFFLFDCFDFTGDQLLGSWSCDDLEFAIPGWGLNNWNFRRFRERTGYGSDFRVISPLKRLETFTGEEYDIPKL